MWFLIVAIIIVAIVFGLGFLVKWLLWVALVLFVIWLITLLVSLIRGRR